MLFVHVSVSVCVLFVCELNKTCVDGKIYTAFFYDSFIDILLNKTFPLYIIANV